MTNNIAHKRINRHPTVVIRQTVKWGLHRMDKIKCVNANDNRCHDLDRLLRAQQAFWNHLFGVWL